MNEHKANNSGMRQPSGVHEILPDDVFHLPLVAFLTGAGLGNPWALRRLATFAATYQFRLAMHFFSPRRHRRKLLFPPGLLALAGLLWLGCVAIGSWQERLSRKVVMQMTMPPKPDSDTIYHYNYSFPRTIPFLYSQLFTLYRWQEITFNGKAAHDSVSALSVSQDIQEMRADTTPNCGIRIRLTPQVKYKMLVHLLDLMTLNNQKKYLFDMYHGPATLYVLVDSYTPQVPTEPFFSCGTGYYSLRIIPPPKAEASQWEQLLQPPEWRSSLWLLTALATLSSWRVLRAWRMA